VRFLNLKLSDRFLILNSQAGQTPQKLPTKSGTLKLLAAVGGAISVFGLVTALIYPISYLVALFAGGLLLLLDSSVLYGLSLPNILLSRTYRFMSYAGLVLLNVSIPAFYSALLFGLSNLYISLGWIMVVAVALVATVIRRIIRG
jgi:hypothetical protein